MEYFKHRNQTFNMAGTADNIYESAYLHQKYIKYVIAELKPALTEIIQQGIDNGDIHFNYPAELAEIVLIVLTVKLDNTLVPSTLDETEKTIHALVALLEKGTDNPCGALDFLMKGVLG